MPRKASIKEHYSWMNGTLFRIFISCLKDWRTTSWLRFCFPETGHLVFGPVESFILSPLLYFHVYPSSSPFNCLNLTHLSESQAPSIPIPTHLTNTYTTEISTLTKRWWAEEIYWPWSSYQLSYWQQACCKSVVPAEWNATHKLDCAHTLPVPDKRRTGGQLITAQRRGNFFQSPASTRVSRIISIVLEFSGFCFYFTHPYPAMNFRQTLTKPIQLNRPFKCKSLGTNLPMSQK